MAAHNDPRNVGREAPTSRSADETALFYELIEALTALGSYLATAHRAFENQQEVLGGEALRASLAQNERAIVCLRRLRELLLCEPPRQ
jgi:phosphoglycerate-specific signal transduction histidine kinase